MCDYSNKVIWIDKKRCGAIADKLYDKISGLAGREGIRFETLRRNSKEVRSLIDGSINCKVIYSKFSDISLQGDELKIGESVFTCPAFNQLDASQITGACVYLATAGDFNLEGDSVMNRLLADYWGTAFVDGCRALFESILEKEFYISNSFGPGFYGMNVRQMKEMSQLIDSKIINVEIKENGLMVPIKSCAGIYLLSKKPFKKIHTACEHCSGTELSCSLCSVNREKETFKCTGACSSCGRCRDAGKVSGANKRKTKLMMLPEDLEPKGDKKGYGIAFDIGTTTVVGTLIDFRTGKEAGTVAKTNPQSCYGMDVISRITFADEKDENLQTLNQCIIACLNEITGELCDEIGIDTSAVVKAVIGGNTTMSHIFAGYNPSSLARAPFNPAYVGTLTFEGRNLGLNINALGEVMLIPNIAGHVGGDITAGILATRLLNEKELTLFLDIGTNGEIVLTDGERTLACSTAAGPAFEGASIYQGMRAASGAIEKVQITGERVLFSTVGDTEPVGICGSGLIDAVAEMIRVGIVNKTGRIVSGEDYTRKSSRERIASRIREGNVGREFVLVYKEQGEDIVITQKDIREVQLAKGAISAGISIMAAALGKEARDIKKVIIAGAFGSFIDRKSAVTIGLLPGVDVASIHSAGNAAGAGAFMAAVSTDETMAIKEIPLKVEHIELAEANDFQKRYIEAMSF